VVACSKKAAAHGTVLRIALAPSGPVRRIFELTQLERGFEIYDDADSAAASFA
jgi:anti-anti-sigma regulatory factor